MKTPSGLGMAIVAMLAFYAAPAPAVDTLHVTSPDPILEKWRWTTFDRHSGLVGEIQDIFVDRDGNVWFGTNQGVQRYDGYRWETYNVDNGLCDNNVRGICQTPDGVMWFATVVGKISRFDPSKKIWTTFGLKDGLTGGGALARCPLYQTRDGALWAGFTPGLYPEYGQGGLNRFDGTRWTAVPVPETMREAFITAISQTPDGAIWVGTWRDGLYRFDGRTWAQEEGLAAKSIESLLLSKDGALWAACRTDGISRFDGTRWHTFSARERLPENASVFGLWKTADGAIWASGHNGFLGRFDGAKWQAYPPGGLPKCGQYLLAYPAPDGAIWYWDMFGSYAYRFDPKGLWQVYTYPDTLGGGYERKDGSVWFFTSKRAVRLKDGVWLGYGPKDGFLDGRVNSVYQTSRGDLWFCGLHQNAPVYARYDGTAWRLFAEQDGIIDTPSGFLEDRHGNLWFSGRHRGQGAVCRFDGREWVRYGAKDGLVDRQITLGCEASDGTLWFGGNRDLYRFKDGQWLSYAKQIAPEKIAAITDIAEWPAGTLWLGWLNGLSWVPLSKVDDPAAWRHKADFAVIFPKIRNLVPTDDALWFGFLPTRGAGVGRYDGKQFQIFTEGDGMASSSVSHMIRASDGSLWCLGGDGLSRFHAGNWTRYMKETGPELSEYTPRFSSIKETTDCNFWIDANDGRMLYFRFGDKQEPPETFLEPALREVSSAGNILLHWSGRDRWDATLPKALRFQWRLDGETWSIPSDRTDFTFTELPSGRHRFEVRTLDMEGEVDTTPAIHLFSVDPPWWRDPWMLGVALILLGGIGVQTGRVVWRDRALQKANASLKREMAGRERLDTQLREVRYLYRLRSALAEAQSPEAVLQSAGQTVMGVLSASASAGVICELDGRTWRFGDPQTESQIAYERALAWAGKARGRIAIFCGITLSEAQERTLLDETAGQITHALEALELQFQLLQSSRLVSLGEMAAGVAHELGQPLSVISTTAGDIYYRMVSNLALPPEQLKEMMQDLLKVVDRMDETVDHMRVFSRDISRESGVPFSVNEAIRNSLKLIGTQLANHGIAVELDLEEEEPRVLGQPHQLEQVFLNLLGNARDALDEKALQEHDDDWAKRLKVRTHANGSTRVLVEVEDNGAGIDDQVRDRIFDPFFTTKSADRGTGLGLSISYAIVRDMGGQITCESRKGEGSIFRVMLPAISANKEEREARYAGI